MIKVIIADDQDMFVEGLTSILNAYEHIIILKYAKNGLELLQLLKKNKPDIVLLDINMPELNGIHTLFYMRKKYPDLKVIILSTHSSSEFVNNLTNLGIDGYILKNTSGKELVHAIEQVVNGTRYFSPKIQEIMENNPAMNINKTDFILSDQEIKIIKLLATGNTTQYIADKLFISIYTVDTHRKNVLAKLQLKNTPELIKYAVNAGLVED
ncbi:MAG: response regulator transcription factor [Bacteroidota bacterium]|nr:response regulator transcription factor [Bacteroidota bacterium]